MNAPHDLRALFHRLVLLASTLPVAACSSTVVGAPTTDAAGDVADASDAADVRDVSCAPRQTGGTVTCGIEVEVPCETDESALSRAGFCVSVCAGADAGILSGCSLAGRGATGGLLVTCITCAVGRRPEGLRADDLPDGGDEVGRLFARIAMLEGASVPAFERLAREMQRLGAPDALTMRCLDAADDERRHTVAMASLAARFGATPGAYAVDEVPAREAVPVAVENAVEGCVHEAFGALLATWQATHAADPEVARTMARIADDETRHAKLSFAIAAWFDTRLDDEARTQSRARRKAALDALRDELAREPGEALVRRAGMPTAAQALHLFEHFAQTLHGDALA